MPLKANKRVQFRCQRTMVSGLMIVITFGTRRKPTIQLDEEQAVVVGEPDAAVHHTPQHDQLMSERHEPLKDFRDETEDNTGSRGRMPGIAE